MPEVDISESVGLMYLYSYAKIYENIKLIHILVHFYT